MAVEFEISTRPLRLDVRRTARRAPLASPYSVRSVVAPDSLYRMTMRHIVRRLIMENKKLRDHPTRQGAKFTTMLAKTLSMFLRERAGRVR
jgi:hypothetical protein